MKLNEVGLKDTKIWEDAGFALPQFDRTAITKMLCLNLIVQQLQKTQKSIHSGFISALEISFVHSKRMLFRTY